MESVAFDLHTLELLQFPKIREMTASYCFTSLGKERAFLINRMDSFDILREEILLVTEMVKSLSLGQAPPFAGLSDIRILVRRASIGSQLTAEQLLQISDALVCTGHMYRYRMRLQESLMALSDLLAPVEDFSLTAKMIQGCIDPRGQVLDMASPELGAVRLKISVVEEAIQVQIRKVIADPEIKKILRYPNATFSGDHCVLPIPANHRMKIQGIVHRTSSTGDTLYIEPARVAKLSSERAILKAEELREIGKILRRLSSEVGKISIPITSSLEILAHVDLIYGKAKFSNAFSMVPPIIEKGSLLLLKQARHPLVEDLLNKQSVLQVSSDEPKKIVPIDVTLGSDYRLLVITGPNTGGKTISLKTVGLLTVMALSGMHVPASDGCIIPKLDNVYADIGDEQSIEQSLSTFSSHISRISEIFKKVSAKNLVLLDEMGAGTDPIEGAALGRAILDGLGEKKCLGMVTTHLGDLKSYALDHDFAQNAAVEFDLETLRPTYRLLTGRFGKSNALRIAKRLDFPLELLRKAHRHLKKKRKGRKLLEMQKEKQEVSNEHSLILQAQVEARQQDILIKQQEVAKQRELEKSQTLANFRLHLKPGDIVLVQRFDKEGRVVRVDQKKGQAKINVGLGEWEIPMNEIFPIVQNN
jgi:DNA mismatch repair protein MutS2